MWIAVQLNMLEILKQMSFLQKHIHTKQYIFTSQFS